VQARLRDWAPCARWHDDSIVESKRQFVVVSAPARTVGYGYGYGGVIAEVAPSELQTRMMSRIESTPITSPFSTITR
jgi:hypothetical protein